ncbi:MAG: LytR family transcriptional regulator, partial [Streptococcus sp.]
MIKKLIGMVLGFLAVTVLGVAVYGYTIFQQGTATLSEKTYKKIGEETNVIEATEPLTILLMGVDTGNVERTDPWAGNSDS